MTATPDARAGRPRASSRETLADAACELFLEQGYAATSVLDITRRAGVSRSSFFNYFSGKGDILWAAFDERVDAAVAGLSGGDEPVPRALAAALAGFAPDSLALAILNAEAMGIEDELVREAAVRQSRIAEAVAARLERDGTARMAAEIAGGAYAAAVLAAVRAWAHEGAGRSPLAPILDRALALAPGPAATAG